MQSKDRPAPGKGETPPLTSRLTALSCPTLPALADHRPGPLVQAAVPGVPTAGAGQALGVPPVVAWTAVLAGPTLVPSRTLTLLSSNRWWSSSLLGHGYVHVDPGDAAALHVPGYSGPHQDGVDAGEDPEEVLPGGGNLDVPPHDDPAVLVDGDFVPLLVARDPLPEEGVVKGQTVTDHDDVGVLESDAVLTDGGELLEDGHVPAVGRQLVAEELSRELPVEDSPVLRRVLVCQQGGTQLKLTGLVHSLPLVRQTKPVSLVIDRRPEGGPVQRRLRALVRHSRAEAGEAALAVHGVEVECSRLALVTVPSLHILLALAPALSWTGGGETAPRVTVTGLLSRPVLGHTASAGEVQRVARHTGLALGSGSEVSTVLRKEILYWL